MMIRRRKLSLSENELYAYLDAGEQNRVAFLPARASLRDTGETLAALANANGGLIFFGVTARGTIQQDINVEALYATVEKAGLLTDPPLLLPRPQVVDSGRGAVLAVEVPSGLPHVYNLQGAYLTRTGAQNRPLSVTELRRMLLERGDSGFEAQTVPGATLADLDEQRINRYLDQVSFSATEEMRPALVARGCAKFSTDANAHDSNAQFDPVPTVAGLLLFGRNPQQFLRSAEIICVRYPGTVMGDEFVRQDVHGTLADQIRQAEAFVTGNMRRGMKLNGLARDETAEYPAAVVREAIVNAVAHRDYSVRGEGIRILMFSDRMEVYSPGRLPGHITLSNLIEERYSRNEAVVAVLSDLGYIERLGYGIDRMIATMQEMGLPAPEFEETAAGFQVTLHSAAKEMVLPQRAELPWRNLHLNERQEQAMNYVHENGRITNSDYQTLVPDVSAETIRRDLADLVERNLLLRIGEKRATYYILK